MITHCIFFLCITIINTIRTAEKTLPTPINTQDQTPPQQRDFQQSPLEKPILTKLVSGRQEIQINSSLPLKGEISILGNHIFDGMTLFFNKLKQDQSLPFMYDLTVLDDDGETKRTHENIQKLQQKSPVFIGLQGSDTIASILGKKELSNNIILFPFDGAQTARTQDNTSFIFFRPSQELEIDALIHYAINTLNKKKIAIFYEASEWGEDAVAALKRVLKKYDLPLVAESSYAQHTLNVSKAVDDITSKAPNAIVCVAHARPAYHFIRQIINKGLYQTVILGLSTLISIQGPLKRSRGIDVITSSVVPDPAKSTLTIAQEFRTDMKTYFPNKLLSPYIFEGYIGAAILNECTKLIKFPLTPQKILDELQNLKNIRFKGLVLRFDPTTRTLSHSVWLNVDEEKEWQHYKPTTRK